MTPDLQPKIPGLSKDAGYQIGARRTFPVSHQTLWEVIISEQGLRIWLGEIAALPLAKNAAFQTGDGIQCEIRAANPGEHVRLSWQPQGWTTASTLQVRVIPTGDRATLSFHQERLTSPEQREAMRQHWQQVLDRLEPVIFRMSGSPDK